MLDAKNIVVVTGGVVADPETVGNNIIKLRLAVDYAGQEKDSDNRSGYFDVVYYGSNDSPNSKFVTGQVKDGKLKKGSQVQLVGRLVQERFKTRDEKSANRVVIVAESLTYAASSGPRKDAAEGGTETAGGATNVPDEF